MTRTVRTAALDTPAARSRLEEGRKHWQALEKKLHLGYRRGPRGGAWYARRFTAGRYVEKAIGISNDDSKAKSDGLTTLDFAAAKAAARDWDSAENRLSKGLSPRRDGPYTVADACDDYLSKYILEGGKAEKATRSTINVHIRPSIGEMPVYELSKQQISKWHRALANAPKRIRTSKAAPQQATQAIDRTNRDALRARGATANRILTVLKAALNYAFEQDIVANDEGWRGVKALKNTDAAKVRYLSADECRRLVNTCPLALRNLVRGALLTGARYGELCNLRIRDVDLTAGTITIREAKGGKSRHVALNDEGVALFDGVVAGRTGTAHVFVRDDGDPWKAAQATRPLTEACRRVAISPAIGFHILRHTYASALAGKGVPMAVIAKQLGHVDTRITEKHYAHLGPSYVADTIRANLPFFGINEETTVRPLRQVG